jgi:hypothetical protein
MRQGDQIEVLNSQLLQVTDNKGGRTPPSTVKQHVVTIRLDQDTLALPYIQKIQLKRLRRMDTDTGQNYPCSKDCRRNYIS